MTLCRICALALLARLLTACGGSGSETPPPVEPTTPNAWQSEADANNVKTDQTTTDQTEPPKPTEAGQQARD